MTKISIHAELLRLTGTVSATMDDDEWLAGRFRMPVEWVREKVRPLLKEFYAMHGQCMMQKRLNAEYAYVTAKRKRRVDAANRRWEKEKASNNASSNASSNTYAPTPTPLKESSLRSPKKNGRRLNADWQPCVSDTEFAEEVGLEPFRIKATADRFRDHAAPDATEPPRSGPH
jgi:uncharacterized protein YdaU (DUF1376 family)